MSEGETNESTFYMKGKQACDDSDSFITNGYLIPHRAGAPQGLQGESYHTFLSVASRKNCSTLRKVLDGIVGLEQILPSVFPDPGP